MTIASPLASSNPAIRAVASPNSRVSPTTVNRSPVGEQLLQAGFERIAPAVEYKDDFVGLAECIEAGLYSAYSSLALACRSPTGTMTESWTLLAYQS